MGICNKCGRKISTRLGSLCMACRYKNKKIVPSVHEKIMPIAARACQQCGKWFRVYRSYTD